MKSMALSMTGHRTSPVQPAALPTCAHAATVQLMLKLSPFLTILEDTWLKLVCMMCSTQLHMQLYSMCMCSDPVGPTRVLQLLRVLLTYTPCSTLFVFGEENDVTGSQ
jgi:hypothetical protein